MKTIIQIVLAIVIVVLSYLIYDSINGRIEFEKQAKERRDAVIERLKDIRTAQIAYKSANGEYAKNFDKLIEWVKTGKIMVVKQIGDAEDSLAVARGEVIRDTIYIPVMDTVFSPNYLSGRKNFYLDSLPFIPNSGGDKFEMDAGEITRNNVKVKVFEVFAPYKSVYKGLDTEKHSIKMDDGLRVGSMTDPSTNGNWE
jgi:type II secretory pathway pseudopilin PulG